jgi:hypothetical protein
MVDHRAVAVCLTPALADRVAALINEHGLFAIPDRLPDDLVWGPPVTGALVDFRLPADPKRKDMAS